jgi:hypothetical protein
MIPPELVDLLQGNCAPFDDVCASNFVTLLNYRASALDQADQNRNDSQDEQNVNESTQRVRADHAQEPKNQEHDGYSPQHRHSFPGSCMPST